MKCKCVLCNEDVKFFQIDQDFVGWTIGLSNSFLETYFEVDTLYEAQRLAEHWGDWIING